MKMRVCPLEKKKKHKMVPNFNSKMFQAIFLSKRSKLNSNISYFFIFFILFIF